MRTLILLALMSVPASAQNALERRLIEEEPCRGATAELMGAEIGVDRLGALDVISSEVLIFEDDLTVFLDTRLTCESPPDSLLTGDATVRINLVARGDLATCETSEAEVTLSEIGGRFGIAIELLADDLEDRLEEAVREQIEGLCDDG